MTAAADVFASGTLDALPVWETRGGQRVVSDVYKDPDGEIATYADNGNMLTREKITGSTTEAWSNQWAGFDKPRWLVKQTTTGTTTTTVGSEFFYNAARNRVIHLELDELDTANAPSHYTRKRIYAFGSTVEIDYEAGTGLATLEMKKVRIYVPGPDGIIGAREYDPDADEETAKVYHYDHLGSIECVTPFASTAYGTAATALAKDDAGMPARFSYDPWGERRDPTDWVGKPSPSVTDDGGADGVTPKGFTGYEMLDDLGLVHMNGRIYDAQIGRFLSADLTVQFPGSLQSFNRYSYVRNNPLGSTDPTGFVEDIWDAQWNACPP